MIRGTALYESQPRRRGRAAVGAGRVGGVGHPQHHFEPVPPGEHSAHRRIHQRTRAGIGRASVGIATLFAVGILVTIAAIGAITAAAGRMMGDVGRWANYFVALIFFVVGLHLLGVIPMPWSGPGQVNMKRKGLFAAFMLGLVFGIALGPCTFAYMAPMLAVTFRLAESAPLYGASLLFAYGVGHCSVIVLAGTFTEIVQRFLNWNEQSKGVTVVKSICGVLVILGGIWLIYSAP